MSTPIIHKRAQGEYSTIVLPDGATIETCWFDNDGSTRVIGRMSVGAVARELIERHEGARND